MPVPVSSNKPSTHPIHKHPAGKLSSNAPVSFQPSYGSTLTCDNLKYVIQRPLPSANYETVFTPLGNSQSTQSIWPDVYPLRSLGATSFSGPYSERPLVVQESTGFSHGLIAAGNATVNKQGRAEALHSPVSQPDSVSSTMGLQRCHDMLGAFEPMWSDCNVDSDDSHSRSLNPDLWSSMQIDECPQFYKNESIGRGYHDSKQLTDGAVLQQCVTPFTDYVDRMVASEDTFVNDQIPLDMVDDICQPDADQKSATEPLSNPAYIRTYRLLAEPLSDWMADFVWKVCSSGMGLPHRYIIPRYLL